MSENQYENIRKWLLTFTQVLCRGRAKFSIRNVLIETTNFHSTTLQGRITDERTREWLRENTKPLVEQIYGASL